MPRLPKKSESLLISYENRENLRSFAGQTVAVYVKLESVGEDSDTSSLRNFYKNSSRVVAAVTQGPLAGGAKEIIVVLLNNVESILESSTHNWFNEENMQPFIMAQEQRENHAREWLERKTKLRARAKQQDSRLRFMTAGQFAKEHREAYQKVSDRLLPLANMGEESTDELPIALTDTVRPWVAPLIFFHARAIPEKATEVLSITRSKELDKKGKVDALSSLFPTDLAVWRKNLKRACLEDMFIHVTLSMTKQVDVILYGRVKPPIFSVADKLCAEWYPNGRAAEWCMMHRTIKQTNQLSQALIESCGIFSSGLPAREINDDASNGSHNGRAREAYQSKEQRERKHAAARTDFLNNPIAVRAAFKAALAQLSLAALITLSALIKKYSSNADEIKHALLTFDAAVSGGSQYLKSLTLQAMARLSKEPLPESHGTDRGIDNNTDGDSLEEGLSEMEDDIRSAITSDFVTGIFGSEAAETQFKQEVLLTLGILIGKHPSRIGDIKYALLVFAEAASDTCKFVLSSKVLDIIRKLDKLTPHEEERITALKKLMHDNMKTSVQIGLEEMILGSKGMSVRLAFKKMILNSRLSSCRSSFAQLISTNGGPFAHRSSNGRGASPTDLEVPSILVSNTPSGTGV